MKHISLWTDEELGEAAQFYSESAAECYNGAVTAGFTNIEADPDYSRIRSEYAAVDAEIRKRYKERLASRAHLIRQFGADRGPALWGP